MDELWKLYDAYNSGHFDIVSDNDSKLEKEVKNKAFELHSLLRELYKEKFGKSCKTCLLHIVATEACIDCRNYDTWMPCSINTIEEGGNQ